MKQPKINPIRKGFAIQQHREYISKVDGIKRHMKEYFNSDLMKGVSVWVMNIAEAKLFSTKKEAEVKKDLKINNSYSVIPVY